jgi:hypothetical protein
MARSRQTYKSFESGTVEAAAGSNTTIASVTGLDATYQHLAFQLENEAEGSAALDVFILQVQVHPDADFITYISDWSTENDRYLIRATATLNTLADNTKAFAYVILPPCNAIRFLASGNAATVDVNVVGVFGRI